MLERNTDRLLFIAVMGVTTLNLVLPGETYYQVRALSQLLIFSLLAFRVLLGPRWPAGNHSNAHADSAGLKMVNRALGLLVLLLLPSLVSSSCPARSMESALLIVSYVALFLLIRLLDLRKEWYERFVSVLCLLVAVLLLYAVYQHFAGFERLVNAITLDRQITPERQAAMLKRLETGRVFSTFPLPTTFAEIVVLSLPLFCWKTGREWRCGRFSRSAPWALCILLAAVVLVWTGSFGTLPVVGLLLLAVTAVGARRWPVQYRRIVAAAILPLLAAGFFFVLRQRGFTPWDSSEPHNPVSQRVLNWRSAGAMWCDRPVTGTGLGNFAVAYTQYRLPGANETRIAHNTYLHLAAEGGILPAATLVLLAIVFAGRGFRWYSRKSNSAFDLETALLLSGTALLVYGLFEITLEFPGIGYPGVAILSLAAKKIIPPVWERDPNKRASGLATGSAGQARRLCLTAPPVVLLAVCLLLTAAWYGSSSLLDRARTADDEIQTRRGAALEMAERASLLNPLDPEPHLFQAGYLLQTERTGRRSDRSHGKAIEAVSRAIQLDPLRAANHDLMSVAHESMGKYVPAFTAADRAWRLYPRFERYQQRRAELLAQLKHMNQGERALPAPAAGVAKHMPEQDGT